MLFASTPVFWHYNYYPDLALCIGSLYYIILPTFNSHFEFCLLLVVFSSCSDDCTEYSDSPTSFLILPRVFLLPFPTVISSLIPSWWINYQDCSTRNLSWGTWPLSNLGFSSEFQISTTRAALMEMCRNWWLAVSSEAFLPLFCFPIPL